jgi:glycosyltransferase involved in cell wall biosynthesis
MRILIASDFGGIVGGRETYLHNVAPLLQLAGHDVRFAFEQPAAAEMPAIVRGLVWRLPVDFDSIAAWVPEVAYVHGMSDPNVERSIASRWPTAYFPHGYYGTCVSGTKCHTRPAIEPCQRTLGLGCLAAYFPHGCGGNNPLTMLRRYWVERRRCANLALFRAVLVASRHMQIEYRNHGVAAERLHLTPLFPGDVSPDPAPPVDRALTGQILLVGRLNAVKGGRLLIDAIDLARQQLKRPLELVVAGDGPEREVMERAAAAVNLPIRFVGWVDPMRRTQLMREADVLAVPSLWPEPFGLVGIEAGCVGLPAAGFAVGGIPDWLEPGVSGESSDSLTAAGLANALTRALNDPAHWQRLRIGAWEISHRFSRQTHLGQLESILQRCAQDGR